MLKHSGLRAVGTTDACVTGHEGQQLCTIAWELPSESCVVLERLTKTYVLL